MKLNTLEIYNYQNIITTEVKNQPNDSSISL